MFRRLIVILLAAVACLLPASESVSATAAIAGDADTYDATIGQRADVPARALDLDSALARGAWEALAGTTTVDAAPFTYDGSPVARVDVHDFDDAPTSQARLGDVGEGSAPQSYLARGASTTPYAADNATEAATSRTFGIADRVAGQLDDVRLGSLRGQLGPDDLQRLVNAPGAQRYYDTATGNINVIQQVDDVLLRITTASDGFKIISVGPIRPNQVTNGVTNGRFVPIGGAG